MKKSKHKTGWTRGQFKNIKMTNNNPLKLKPVWLTIGVMMLLAVAILSLIPIAGTGVNDKLSHLITYAVLAGWFVLQVSSIRALLMVMLGLIAYGALIELLQGQTDYRQAELADVFANALGVFIGVLIYRSALPALFRRCDHRLAALVGRS